MVRYLRVKMTGHARNDNGLYCTLTQLKVFGSSLHKVMRDISMDLVSNDVPESSNRHAATVQQLGHQPKQLGTK